LIFVDTGAFLARHLARDQYHERAVAAWGRIRGRIATSNLVLAETFTLLGRWADYVFAAGRARVILASAALSVLRAGSEEESEAVDLFEKYADQRVSYTDCVSFVLMRRHGIERAFTFDRHFEAAGLRIWP